MTTFPLALLCPLLGFGIVLLAVISIIGAIRRSISARNPMIHPAPLLTASTDEDGFWISCDQIDPAGIVQYVYWSGGLEHTGQVLFEPDARGRQFVYTGAKPERVTVSLAGASAVEAGADLLRRSRPLRSDPPVFDPPDSTPAPSSGFPSAY